MIIQNNNNCTFHYLALFRLESIMLPFHPQGQTIFIQLCQTDWLQTASLCSTRFRMSFFVRFHLVSISPKPNRIPKTKLSIERKRNAHDDKKAIWSKLLRNVFFGASQIINQQGCLPFRVCQIIFCTDFVESFSLSPLFSEVYLRMLKKN